MIDAAQLLTLTAILDTGSFEAAAARLGITPSAVSQRLKALEDRMGTALIIREQPARATDAGTRLARHAADIRLLEQALTTDLGAGLTAERPTLRIAVNADSLASWVLPALAAMSDLLFDLVIDDQDHSADLLRRGEVQAAVTAHAAAVTGCDCHDLGALRYIATASPGFAARWFPDGITAEHLAHAPALTFNRKDRLQRDWAANLTGKRIVLPSHYLASSQGFVEAARLGLGWGMNPEPLVHDDIESGHLVALVPDRPLDTPLYWQVNRLTARALAPLTAAIRMAAKSCLRPVA